MKMGIAAKPRTAHLTMVLFDLHRYSEGSSEFKLLLRESNRAATLLLLPAVSDSTAATQNAGTGRHSFCSLFEVPESAAEQVAGPLSRCFLGDF